MLSPSVLQEFSLRSLQFAAPIGCTVFSFQSLLFFQALTIFVIDLHQLLFNIMACRDRRVTACSITGRFHVFSLPWNLQRLSVWPHTLQNLESIQPLIVTDLHCPNLSSIYCTTRALSPLTMPICVVNEATCMVFMVTSRLLFLLRYVVLLRNAKLIVELAVFRRMSDASS